MPTLPSRLQLLAEYRKIVDQMAAELGCNYSTGFYGQMRDCVFDHAWAALTDVVRARPKARMHVLSAATGSGKTTFSLAFIIAYTRACERAPNAPKGCLFLVRQIAAADDLYRKLERWLPGKVAVWTSAHDKDRNPKPADMKVKSPATRFSKDELEEYPVVIVTHELYKKKGREKALRVWDGDMRHPQRALTIVDEQAGVTNVFDIALSEAQAVKERLQTDESTSSQCNASMAALCDFMFARSDKGPNLETPKSDPAWSEAAERLQWFNRPEARRVVQSSGSEQVKRVFGFAKAVANCYAFITRVVGSGTRYLGYETELYVTPGMLLLDATADINGVTQLCRWQVLADVPKARFDNLQIVHLPTHTKSKRLPHYLKKLSQRRAYARWLLDIIEQNMGPGQKGLVVCKLALFDNKHVPDWSEADPRWDDPESYQKRFEWNYKGRNLCATNWGSGVGFNDWKDADVVFLFDEHILPKGAAIATAQGAQMLKATEGELGVMKTLNSSKAKAVHQVWEGHTLAWLKQMAIRGNARNFDEHGVCGKQKLVLTCDHDRLTRNLHDMFPGAEAPSVSTEAEAHDTYWDRVRKYLSQRGLPREIKAKALGRGLGFDWRKVGRNFIHKPAVQQALANLGWEYRQGNGRAGSTFVRLKSDKSLAAA